MSEYCCDLARQAHEPLIGTASRTDYHLILSLPKGEWAPKAAESGTEAAALQAAIAPLGDLAMFTLKNSTPDKRGTLWLFPQGLRFDGLTPADYPRLVEDIARGEFSLPHVKLAPQDRYLLICTHGKRDIACAKFGGDMHRALADHLPPNFHLWESSHIGGHRFAGTLIVQPLGHWYGFLTPNDAPLFLRTLKQGGVLTERYRGNANYPPALQAAEAWGWQRATERGGTASIKLVNPIVGEEAAQVVLAMTQRGNITRTRLSLIASPHTFVPDSGKADTKTRLVWKVHQAEALTV